MTRQESRRSPAALSVAVYGVYLLLNGIGLLTWPSLPLALLGLPPPVDPWIRVLGLVAGEVGFYFLFAARRSIDAFFPATVYGRAAAAAIFLMLVLLKLGPPQLLVFAAVDLLTAAWTYVARRRQSP